MIKTTDIIVGIIFVLALIVAFSFWWRGLMYIPPTPTVEPIGTTTPIVPCPIDNKCA
jgi:hypothetical protein